MTQRNLKLEGADLGYCRFYYTWTNNSNERFLYCIQQEYTDDFRLYRCSKDGEPNYEVDMQRFDEIELPVTGKEKLAIELSKFLRGRQS